MIIAFSYRSMLFRNFNTTSTIFLLSIYTCNLIEKTRKYSKRRKFMRSLLSPKQSKYTSNHIGVRTSRANLKATTYNCDLVCHPAQLTENNKTHLSYSDNKNPVCIIHGHQRLPTQHQKFLFQTSRVHSSLQSQPGQLTLEE